MDLRKTEHSSGLLDSDNGLGGGRYILSNVCLCMAFVLFGSNIGLAQVVLSENFSALTSGDNTSTSNQLTSWAGDTLFPTVGSAYQAGGAVKLGTSGAIGTIRSKALDLSGGAFDVSFDVKGWATVEGGITVTATGQTAQTVNYTSVMSGSFETKVVHFSAGTAATMINLATTARRAFLDNIIVTRVSSSVAPTVTISTGSYTYNGSYQGPGVSDVNKGGSTGALTLQYGGSSMVGVQYGPATIPPIEAGNYTLVATVAADANYSQGIASANFTISKATATVNISGTDQIYDGTPKQVAVNTSPENLPVTIMYSGSSAAPTLVGDYSVMATVTSPNYSGAASGRVLKIAKGTPLLSGITATSIAAGQALSTSTIRGTAKNAGGFDVSGIWAFNNASSTPSVGTSDQGATFTPTDTTNYNTASTTISVTVLEAPPNNFTSTINNGEVTITGYTGAGGAVVIPGTIGGSPVTSIGNFAFQSKSNLIAVSIPNGVTTIGSNAFADCANLASVTIPGSVTLIMSGAFFLCPELTTISIPSSVDEIQYNAFFNCYKLASVYFLRNTPPTIGADAFKNIASGAVGYYPAGATGYASLSISSLTFEVTASPASDFTRTTDGTSVTITGYIGTGGAVVIPGTIGGLPVTAIANQAFKDKTTITSITLPDSVLSIGYEAFYRCEYLATVSLGSGVTTIGDWAFGHCYKLKSISIPNSVTSLGNGALSDCVELESVVLGNQVPSLGRYTFTNDYKLSSITLPASMASIGEQAFSHCRSLATVNFQQSLPPSVNADSFMDISILAKGYFFPAAMSAWSSVSISGLTFPQIKASQTINFGALPNKTVGDGAFAIAATASSGLAVSYVSSDLNVATVNGNTVTILGAGTTTITASQPGDDTYHAAPSINVLLTVSGSGGGTGGGTGGGLSQVPAPVLNLPATLTYGQKLILPGAAQSLQVSKSVNQTIPSGTPTGMSSSATVSGLTGSNYSFTLGVRIVPVVTGGGFLGDLRAYLRHELLDENGGTLVNQTRMLIDQIGVTQADPDGSLADGLDVIFGDSFSNNIQEASAAGGSLLSGNFAPASSFAGTDPARAGPFSGLGGTSNLWNGTYTLVVADMSTGAEMKLDSWSMHFHSLAASVGVGNPLVVGNPGAFSPEGGLTYEIVESGVGTQESGLGKINANQLEAKSGTGTITIRAKYAATLTSAASEWTTKTILLTKKVQTITFPELGTRSLAPTFTVGATTDSLLPLTYSSSITGTATIGASGQITPVAVGTTMISVEQVGDANFSSATVSRLLTIAGTPLNPAWGLSKLYSQDSTNSAVAGVTKGTNTSAYTKIEYAEASATAQIAMVPISFGGSEVVNLTQTNVVAPGVIGYSSYSNPASFTSYSDATNAVPDGPYDFVGKNMSNAVVTNAVVNWSNNTIDYPVQAPQIGGTWIAQSLRIANPAIADTISWAAWTNSPVVGSTNSIRVEVTGSFGGGSPTSGPSSATGKFVTNLPANSTNLAIPAGTLPTNQVYSAKVAFVTMTGGAARSTETQFRLITGPKNPPVNPVLPGALIGNINVAPGADEVGQLASFSDSDGDSGTFSLPALTWPGSNDNYLFVLNGDGRTIKLAGGKFDYARQSFYSILVRATDIDGLYSETTYTIVVRQDVSNDISLTGPLDSEYDGNPKSFSALVFGGGVLAIEYQGQNGTSYAASAIAPTNVGYYTVTATATDLDKIGSKSEDFTIRKGIPAIISPPTSTPIIYGQTLASSPLNGGSASPLGTFAFTRTSTAPNAGTGSQEVTFTPSDTANYNTTTTSVSVTVSKGTPTILSLPTSSTMPYGQALSSSGLSGGEASVQGTFGWTTPSTIPASGTSSQSVVFTPSDSANYNKATASVTVTVALDPSGDEDGDGATNEAELAAGTDPYDSASGPYQPVAFGDAFTAKLAAGMTTKVTTASLISNDKYSGIPGETRGVTFVSATGTSTGGASIRVKGGWLIYQPSPIAQNGTTDTFIYTVTNGTKTATGTVTVSLVAPDYVAEVAIDRVSGNQVYFSVMPGMTFEVQGTSQLGTSPTWTTITGPNNGYWTSGADGRLIVTDPAAVGAVSRFYQFRWVAGTVSLPSF